jgi:GNAT superfamily N-acetyltransferase
MTESIVRTAGPDDYEEVWRLFLQNHKENGLFKPSPPKVQWLLNRVLYPQAIPPGDTGTRGVIGVIGPVNALEGIVFVTISEYWYSAQKHIEEFMVYVDPECRKSGHAVALVQWMKDQAAITGLPLLTGVMSNHRTEAKCRLYRRMLPKIGELFMVSPNGSASHFSASATSSG